MMKLLSWTLLALALLTAQAQAQTQTKKELAAKLLQLQQSGAENVGRALAGQLAQRILQSAGNAIQRVAPEKREAVGREIQADVKKFHDEIEPLLRERALRLAPSLAPTIEERFTEDELKQVIAWVESPVSKKYAQLDSDLGNALAEKVIADTRSTVETKAKALEAGIGKRLGLPVAAPTASGVAPKK